MDSDRRHSVPLLGTTVFVAGAGIMGAGIAQVAAQAGHPVRLFDKRAGAAAAARGQLAAGFDTLVAKGRIGAAVAQQTLARIETVDSLTQATGAGLVVEAIVEQLDAKCALFAELEGLIGEGAVLATNTSSISVTAIARGLRHPGRVVGMHFFNPVSRMLLVEVVSGLQTDPAVAAAIFDLARAWGKVPVHAKSTPGFIVNRIARPYYAEALALLQECAAAPAVVDAALRGAGFRMGPCALMDLIGHDTNLAVTKSVFEANFHDRRYQPSVVQAEMVAGGLLGRKSGRGFFRYPEGAPALPAAPAAAVPAGPAGLVVHGSGVVADGLAERIVMAFDAIPERDRDSGWTGLQAGITRWVMTDGRTAAELAAGWPGIDVAVFDRLFTLPAAGPASAEPATPGVPLAFAVARDGPAALAAGWLAALGFLPLQVADTPGLIAARTVAMLVNEAADAVQQGVCDEAAADAAMKLGVNHPAGPFEFLRGWNATGVVALLDTLDRHYRGERYRVSPWLRRRTL